MEANQFKLYSITAAARAQGSGMNADFGLVVAVRIGYYALYDMVIDDMKRKSNSLPDPSLIILLIGFI